MSRNIWHRFPREDYEKLQIILNEMVGFGEDELNSQEKKQVLQLMKSMEKGFKAKKIASLKLELLIKYIGFYLAVNAFDNNEIVQLKRILRGFTMGGG